MLSEKFRGSQFINGGPWGAALAWCSGLWIAPIWCLAYAFLPRSPVTVFATSLLAIGLAPVPSILILRRQSERLRRERQFAAERMEELRLQTDSVRYRASQLREELSAADRQARLSHQLTILGRFTAGFMHEFNNPLAIVASRLEVLLQERKDDASLCADLQQMLKETNYMGRIARTLLQALRRERGSEVFAPSEPAASITEALDAMRAAAEVQGVRVDRELGETPRVDVPGHVVSEVVRGLVSNSLNALNGRTGGEIRVRLEPYRTAGATVTARVEDNGPGVPESIRARLFEPFVTQTPGRERLGLGLFLAASLLDMYDGTIRYEGREGGGAGFVLELPPARFTRGQAYHWFPGGSSA